MASEVLQMENVWKWSSFQKVQLRFFKKVTKVWWHLRLYLTYRVSLNNVRDIQGGTLFKGGHYLRKYGVHYMYLWKFKSTGTFGQLFVAFLEKVNFDYSKNAFISITKCETLNEIFWYLVRSSYDKLMQYATT